jgi:hypothetical protein
MSYNAPYEYIIINLGGYIAVGSTRSRNGGVSGYNGGDTDAWIVKLSPETKETPVKPSK